MQSKEGSTYLPTISDVSDNRDTISTEITNLTGNHKKLDEFKNFKNSIVAGDNNFMNITEDYRETVKSTIKNIDSYLDQASKTMEEILELIGYDNSVRARAQKIYDDYMASTAPHKKTVTGTPRFVNGVWETPTETIDTYAEDENTASSKRDEYWRANNSWVWED